MRFLRFRSDHISPRGARGAQVALTGTLALSLTLSLILFTATQTRAQGARATAAASVTVFATGLNNPRGLAFGPDGALYVAEGGMGGTSSTVGQCTQVPDVGPYSGGFTSRISKISSSGVRTTVVSGLPSSQTNPASGSLVSGVAAVQFIDGVLYGTEAGAG